MFTFEIFFQVNVGELLGASDGQISMGPQAIPTMSDSVWATVSVAEWLR